MSTVPRTEYPRPQFRRENWTNLNGEWRFAFDDEDRGRREGWQNTGGGSLRDGAPFDRTITVPFCYQSELSGIGETAFHDVVWYARTFDHAVSTDDERLLLHFGAVDYRAEVWVNGVHVASHEGGHTPFSADVTHALGGPENVLVVRAEDPSRDETIPRGKQYWREESEGIFYTRTTGIWQPVWLEPVNRSRIEGLRLTPNVDAACVDAEVEIEGAGPGTSLRVVVELDGETVLDDAFTVRSALMDRRFPLVRRGEAPDESRLSAWTGLALWSPEKPNLYDLYLELLNENGDTLDSIYSYFGMRKVEI
nr:glycoside hydrolase family 2 [Actinomycetota bacterium]